MQKTEIKKYETLFMVPINHSFGTTTCIVKITIFGGYNAFVSLIVVAI
jgi:hypothetical protein